jgi:hypothetical protein
MEQKIKFFKENGYYIEKGLYHPLLMNEIFILFYDVFYTLSIKHKVILRKHYKRPNEVQRNLDLKELDNLMLDCFHYDKDIIGEGYDIISYSSTFLRFISNAKIEITTRQLLELQDHSTLYGWTNRVRIDPPSDERRTYGWHQEVFYTIPESIYLQTWAPVIRDTTKFNGTIWIAPKSNSEGIAKQKWNDIQGKATQIIIDQDIVNKYEPLQLEMEVGDVLFFDGKLFHKSGSNTTEDEIRFSLVGMWHNTDSNNFKAPRPNFLHRTEYDQKEYWENCNKLYNWGY